MADRPADVSRAVRALGSDGRRAALRLGVVPEVLHGLLLERAAAVGTSAGTTADTTADTTAGALDVLDVGGGTGGFAVPLAREGHRVTVVDPSPDALAALERRAAEAGVPVRAVQGDLSDLLDVVPAAGADVVLVHGALEHADDPAAGGGRGGA
ncbi:MAG: class I SAM-dependent methyltransferase, partial [Motilibacteraceae bacterium]